MGKLLVKKSKVLKGEVEVPGDKSISHRALIFSSMGEGESIIRNFLFSQDCISTMNCLKSLGVSIEVYDSIVRVKGNGIKGFKEPENVLDAGNSGTTIRLLTGLLSGLPGVFSVITGDSSLRRRPMKRVVDPLRKMGANIWGRNNDNNPPLAIKGEKLVGESHILNVASAQVKSALLIAGLLAEGETCVTEPSLSRDHTERMFQYLGLPLKREGLTLKTHGIESYKNKDFNIPGDFSSAAFIIAAGLLVEGSKVIIKNVGINPTRTGMLDILKEAGAKFNIIDTWEDGGELIGNLMIEYSDLKAFEIKGDIVPTLIDEVPILAIIATQAKGESIFKDVEELKVKESDRIKAVVDGINKMGGKAKVIDNGFVVYGPTKLKGGEIETYGDHRIAMAFAIAGLIADDETIVESDSINISFPTFTETLKSLGGNVIELQS
ncbi:3-phosphoshikimate 1-carboxyvinyltransferase [Dictyoglomus thermophilum]|uniref:3-phosphoshikimate 1-carboxyvinyltransferase n=1 Tax=Dictyoglomus thermophilum TaxID=14 RepID=A0A7V3ZIJ9_DICTH|nr:3-phosphoshikimate 1-carboxyvinyltransferase [Dictyoglomus thermophilum]TYT22395.1 3-phosphoshikimate 1-carboxyvinyltransferase [Dictyoglomus thermophilum]